MYVRSRAAGLFSTVYTLKRGRVVYRKEANTPVSPFILELSGMMALHAVFPSIPLTIDSSSASRRLSAPLLSLFFSLSLFISFYLSHSLSLSLSLSFHFKIPRNIPQVAPKDAACAHKRLSDGGL